MNVGIVGLGKLGLPVAYAMASRRLNVYGYDPLISGPPADCTHEHDLAETIHAGRDRVWFTSLPTVVEQCDTVFVAVQTPHERRFEGVTPLPDDRADFDYSFLVQAVKHLSEEAERQERHLTVAVISTVLPGTMARHVRPVLGGRVELVYTPSFIAMGTVIRDFLDPEFVLLGGDNDGHVENVLAHVYGLDRPRHVRTTVENAELIKVAYNTMIGLKIAYANTLMEVCHKTGCDVDEVTGALKLAHRRLISPAYLDGGMGDGGGCHPRDNIALSWLARELDLSYDLFDAAMTARERQAGWLCDLMLTHARDGLPYAILGVEFKPGSDSTTGSAAMLCANLLADRGHHVHAYGRRDRPTEPAVFLVGCKHPQYAEFMFPAGSVVIDPHRYIPDQPGIEVIRVGEGERPVPDHRQAREGRELPARAA